MKTFVPDQALHPLLETTDSNGKKYEVRFFPVIESLSREKIKSFLTVLVTPLDAPNFCTSQFSADWTIKNGEIHKVSFTTFIREEGKEYLREIFDILSKKIDMQIPFSDDDKLQNPL